jgi:hypothetical protein
MLVKAPSRQQVDVYFTEPAKLTSYSWEDRVITAVPTVQPAGDVIAFYARMVKKYESMPYLEHHTHERPKEHNSF